MKQLMQIEENKVERTKDILGPPCLFTDNNACENIWETERTCNIKIQMVGNRITLTLPRVMSTANTSGYIQFITQLPAEVRPTQDHYSSIHVTDNSVVKHGTLIIKTNGDILIYAGLNSGVFTGSGDTGFESTSVTYMV